MTRLRLNRTPQIDPTAFIAPNTSIVGDVEIGAESSVWFGAVIRADTEAIRIGARTNIQDGCILHADPGYPIHIGNNVTVGHGAIVHSATIEDCCLVGMRATILNGAVVGANSIVGAGAVVTEGMVIPPNSLVVGVPAKVKRQLAWEQAADSCDSADHYVEYACAYRESSFGSTTPVAPEAGPGGQVPQPDQ